MRKSVLITGATGSVGREILATWASRDDINTVVLVHRQLPDGIALNGQDIEIVRGDVTKPGLGLSKEVRHRLTSSLTHILHSAANTRFDQNWDDAYRSNVQGTVNMLDFAADCSNLVHFGYVSSAFIAGRREGIIREDELDHEAGFSNNYERSKFQAERIVRARNGDMSIGVFRPSIVLGDSRTGAVCGMQASHQTMRMLYLTGAPFMPGSPDYPVDFVPTDLVTRAISTLLVDRPDPGTYHLTSGPDKSFTLSDFFTELYRLFGEMDPEWRQRGFNPPRIVRSDLLFGKTRRGEDLEVTRHFAAQLDHPKDYDQTHLFQTIPEYESTPRHCRHYLPKVVDYLIRTSWCRKAA